MLRGALEDVAKITHGCSKSRPIRTPSPTGDVEGQLAQPPRDHDVAGFGVRFLHRSWALFFGSGQSPVVGRVHDFRGLSNDGCEVVRAARLLGLRE